MPYTVEIKAPREFPKGNSSEYPIINNSTLRRNLSSLTEQEDMRKGGEYEKMKPTVNKLERAQGSSNKTEITDATNVSKNPKFETEFIENGDNTEDFRRLEKDLMFTDEIRMRNDSHEPSDVPLVQGQLVAILAGIFVIIAIVGYAALLSWRHFLE